MSIYNGFSTRKLETSYNKSLFNMMFLLQRAVFKVLSGEDIEQTFPAHFMKQFKRMYVMEDQKYLPPKYSYALKDLAKYYDCYSQLAGPLSSLSKMSSEQSFTSNPSVQRGREPREQREGHTTVRSTHSLKTIKETKAKKSMSRIKFRHQSSIKSRRRKISGALPPLVRRSRSNSKTRSRSKSNKKLKNSSKVGKPLKFRKMKSKVLMAAERRGVKIKHTRPVPLNQTLSQFRSPDNRFEMAQNMNNSNVLISDRGNMNSISEATNYTGQPGNLPEFMKRLKNLESNGGSINNAISEPSHVDEISNLRYSSQHYQSDATSNHYSKSEHIPNVQVNLNTKYNICDNIIIQGDHGKKIQNFNHSKNRA